ncbi:cupin domain-containing protein [Nocardioides sp. AE5]|uniref:cupin domain-containing protein n=1 Tax=Nocardioides sp. AE5 TaxID=2962573 RepID=UPI002880F430|nr:cupin domain-containing protein [Nocardioides sp. AE5]MDT0201509.1 LuxR family transcriptional regulator [Nocardioides sp. AE5]
MSEPIEPVNLTALAAELVADLPNHTAGRTAKSVLHGDGQRAVLMALAADAALAEHDAPGPACLQVLQGEVVLIAGDQRWELGAGDLVPIPPVRHSVQARTDAVFLLTIALPG